MKNISISVIIPIYNGANKLEDLITRIKRQIIDAEIEIIAAVTKSKDNSLDLAYKLCDKVIEIKEFNHAKTRHKASKLSQSKYLVFITQDIEPYNNEWLHQLIYPLENNHEVVATYSRQIAYPEADIVESLMRKYNYPDYDRLCNNHTKIKWGRKNIFFSNSSSATRRDFFIEVNGLDFETNTNEDVIYASKVLESNKSTKYCSKSIVYHSHNHDFIQLFERYYSIGKFEKKYSYVLKEYKSVNEGISVLFDISKELIRKRKYVSIVRVYLSFAIRFISYKIGYYYG